MAAAAWIGPRLGPFGGWVGSVVPEDFEAYARIVHPIPGPNQEWATWAAVCASLRAGPARPDAVAGDRGGGG